jgi:hypothetical protein
MTLFQSCASQWRRIERFKELGMLITALLIGAGLGWTVGAAIAKLDATEAAEKARLEGPYWQPSVAHPQPQKTGRAH